MLLDVVLDADERRRLSRGLRALGDRRADDLTVVRHDLRLQHRQLAFGFGELRRVLVRDDGQHALEGTCRGIVDPRDTARGDGRRDDVRVGSALAPVLERILRLARNLLGPLDPVDGRPDRPLRDTHGVSSRSVRTSVLRASSTL